MLEYATTLPCGCRSMSYPAVNFSHAKCISAVAVVVIALTVAIFASGGGKLLLFNSTGRKETGVKGLRFIFPLTVMLGTGTDPSK